jgi:adenosylcobyric acid synthase
MADLAWLKTHGLGDAIQERALRGIALAGICGGYQILGTQIFDPYHVESSAERMAGLGLLPIETTFAKIKATRQVRARVRGGPGWLANLAGLEIGGYEIHMGTTTSDSGWLDVIERNGERADMADGAVSGDGRTWGCYLHGLFADDTLRRAWLASLRKQRSSYVVTGRVPGLDSELDRLADAVETALDIKRLDELCHGPRTTDHGRKI